MKTDQKKSCRACGEYFRKHKKYSAAQWKKAAYCSSQCAGKGKKGVPRSEDTKSKLSNAHKGASKPWAGKYKRTPVHREAIREGLLRMSPGTRARVAERVSLTHTGRKVSEATKRKLREAAKRDPKYKGGQETFHERKAFYQRRREANKRAAGSHSLEDWEAIKAIYDHQCPACLRKEPDIYLTEDHVVPLSEGGSDTADNIQPLCHSCNSSKNTKSIRYLPLGYRFGVQCPEWPKRRDAA